jgi:hypothetical protein
VLVLFEDGQGLFGEPPGLGARVVVTRVAVCLLRSCLYTGARLRKLSHILMSVYGFSYSSQYCLATSYELRAFVY